MALLQMKWQPSLLHHKRKNGGPPLGLKNLGNSCYLNSVLQCLTYTPPLANFCLKNQHSSFCDSASEPDRKRECPFCILEKRIVRSLSIDLALDAPAKIVSCLRIFAEHFRCGRQEDAHEFLRYVIDACHNTSLRLKKLQQQRSRKSINGGGGECFNGNTIVKEIFGGALQSQVKCLSCGTESNKVDEIMDICLEVTQSNSLKEAMKKFFQAEILDGNNKYKCERCKKLVTAKKQMSILQAPNILVVQLKRFEGIFGGKIDRMIAFEEILVLSSFMCKASQDPHPEYSLFAIIVHSGFSPESGHYYAYIKDAVGRWYCCNDSYVTLSTLQDVLSEKAYILFFTRTSSRPVSADTAVVSNRVKSHDINGHTAAVVSNGVNSHEISGSNTFKSPKSVIPATSVSMKPSIVPSLVKGTPVASKAGDASTVLQNKFSGLANSLAKRVSGNGDGKTDVGKRGSVVDNGNVTQSVSRQMNGKNVCTSENNKDNCRNGKHTVVESSHYLANGNGHLQDRGVGSVKGDVFEEKGLRERENARKCFDNGAVSNVRTNGHADISGSKRKLEDSSSCILLAKDSQSRARVEEFKKVLLKEAAQVLRTCGWSDKVYEYMRSRKRLCMDVQTSDNNVPQKMLVADAKATFNSQVPGSLKGSLIERIRSFSKEK